MSAESSLLRAELRGETRLYALAALTTAFAAAALTLVLALADTFERSFASSARTLLGGDVSVRLRARDFSPPEEEWLRDNSAGVSFVRVAAVLAVADDNAQMTRVKIADSAYPLYGELKLQGGGDLQALLSAEDADGVYPAAVDTDFLELANLRPGDTFSAAGLTMRIAEVVTAEPDPDPRMWMAAPLILAGESAAAGGNFSGAGMLSSRFARVRLAEGESVDEWTARLQTAFPEAGWNVRAAAAAMPGLRRFVERMRAFLSIMSLAAILTAGIGIGGATSAFLRARMRAIAVVKMLGGSEALVARVYLKIAAIFIAGGALAGAICGAALSYQAAPYLSSALPLPLSPHWPWAAFFKAILVATATGAAFAVLPVSRAGRINPLALFNAGGNEQDSPPYSRRDILIAAAVWIPALLFLPLEWREKFAAGAIALAAAVLYALSAACAGMAGAAARRLPPPFSWGLTAVARNRRQTATGVVALGVGMALLVAILNIEGNFAARINDTLRQEAPTFYLTGARTEQRESLQKTLTAVSEKSRLRTIPFLRGKIAAIGGRDSADIDAPSDFRWILGNDRALTWTENGDYIGASKVSDGVLWDDSETRPQASFDSGAADAFGLELGDELELTILGRRLTTVITSFREIDWQSFDINFVVILDRRPFGDAPYSLMGAAFLPPEDENRAKLEIVRAFPNITPIAMSAVFEVGRRLLENVSLLLQAAALFMLFGAAPVIVASLMDGQRRRVRDAITLRLLGASTGALIIKGMAEFAAMAAAALLPAIVFGLVAGKLVVEHIFDLHWNIGDGSPLVVACGGVTLFLIFGCAGIAKWVRQPPLAIIRNE